MEYQPLFLDELLCSRCSVRSYRSEAANHKDILACIQSACLAPSSRNSQPWKFVIATEQGVRRQIAELVMFPPESNPLKHNPPIFVAMTQEIENQKAPEGRHAAEYFVDIDHGIAAGYFCLKAAEMGLGSCIIGAFHEEPLKELLHIPVEKKVKILLAVGYPAEGNLQKTASAKNRKQLEELVCWEQYGSELKKQE